MNEEKPNNKASLEGDKSNMLQQNSVVQQHKKLGLSLLRLQTYALLAAGLGFGLQSWASGYAALLGAASGVLPNALFMLWLFAQIQPSKPQKMMRALYLGELMKLILMAGCLIAIFKWLSPQPGISLIAFIIVLVVYWLAPFIINRGSENK